MHRKKPEKGHVFSFPDSTPYLSFVSFVLFVVEKSGFQLDSQHTIFVRFVVKNPDCPATKATLPPVPVTPKRPHW